MYSLLKILIFFLICLASCKSGSNSSGSDPQSELTPETERRIVNQIKENLVPYGYSTFALGVPNKFPLEDNQNIEGIGYKVVAQSVRRVAVNFLYAFPEPPDPNQAIDFVKFLIDQGHIVTYEVYVMFGPAIRAGSDRIMVDSVGNAYSSCGSKSECVEVYKDLIWNNSVAREAVRQEFAGAVNHAKEVEALGADVYICPEIEDNDDKINESGFFGKLYMNWLREFGWTNPDGSLRRDKVVRNGGSARNRIPGIRYELHPHSMYELAQSGLVPGDFWNNDGRDFWFESDNRKPDFFMSEEEIRWMRQWGEDHNVVGFIWYNELQGAITREHGDEKIGPYRDRAYIMRSPRDMIAVLLGIPVEEVVLLEDIE